MSRLASTPDIPPFFRRRKFPVVGGSRNESNFRDQNRKAGNYGRRWDDLSISFRKKNPFCLFCEQEGFECSPVDDVDHIVPLRKPFSGKMFDWSNLQSLCRKHHSGLKARLEYYAEKNSAIDLLLVWCSDPESRPDTTKRVL